MRKFYARELNLLEAVLVALRRKMETVGGVGIELADAIDHVVRAKHLLEGEKHA